MAQQYVHLVLLQGFEGSGMTDEALLRQMPYTLGREARLDTVRPLAAVPGQHRPTTGHV